MLQPGHEVNGCNWELPVASGLRDIGSRLEEKVEAMLAELQSYLTVVDQVWDRSL